MTVEYDNEVAHLHNSLNAANKHAAVLHGLVNDREEKVHELEARCSDLNAEVERLK